MASPLLFLDFDGVLHPDPVFMREGIPYLDPNLGTLFEWAPALGAILADYPAVDIVLSTSWVQHFSMLGCIHRLPDSLTERVVDCVRERHDYIESGFSTRHWWALTRYQQILQYVKRKRILHWIAIDNDVYGWPARQRHHLVATQDDVGIGDAPAQADLREKLAIVCAAAAADREESVGDQLGAVFDAWGVNETQRKKLLGADLTEANEPAVQGRALRLISIAEALATLEKRDRHYSASWLFNPNKAFGWKSPVDLCWEEGTEGVARVQTYLEGEIE